MSKIPAIAAAALLGSVIASSSAHAATARIDPVSTVGGQIYATATIGIAPAESCAMSYRAIVLAAYPGAPMMPVWRGRTTVVNPCADHRGTFWEDGSISVRIGGPIMPAWRLRRHARYVLGLYICSGVRGRIACHTNVRAFWA
jgi:hypothetical protein